MPTDLLKGLPKDVLMADLGERMSRISEVATCCGWHADTADVVPRACYEIVETSYRTEAKNFGVGIVEARVMVAIASELGHWVTLGERRDWDPYVPESMKERALGTVHATALLSTGK